MVASWKEEKHASEVASMALHLMREIKFFVIPHRPVEALKLRIGLHSGTLLQIQSMSICWSVMCRFPLKAQ